MGNDSDQNQFTPNTHVDRGHLSSLTSKLKIFKWNIERHSMRHMLHCYFSCISIQQQFFTHEKKLETAISRPRNRHNIRWQTIYFCHYDCSSSPKKKEESCGICILIDLQKRKFSSIKTDIGCDEEDGLNLSIKL